MTSSEWDMYDQAIIEILKSSSVHLPAKRISRILEERYNIEFSSQMVQVRLRRIEGLHVIQTAHIFKYTLAPLQENP